MSNPSKHKEKETDTFAEKIEEENLDRNGFFYLPARILHIDSDENYLNKCLNYYKKNKLQALYIGKTCNSLVSNGKNTCRRL